MLHIHVYCQKRSIIFKVVEVYEREKKTREITNKRLGYHEELPWQLIKNKGDVIRFKFCKLVIKDMIGWLKVSVNVAQTKPRFITCGFLLYCRETAVTVLHAPSQQVIILPIIKLVEVDFGTKISHLLIFSVRMLLLCAVLVA